MHRRVLADSLRSEFLAFAYLIRRTGTLCCHFSDRGAHASREPARMTSLVRMTIVIVGVILLSACGLLKSPADDIDFEAPSGWTSTPGIMGRFQLWTGGTTNKQVLMLMKLPQDAKIDRSFDASDFKGMSGSASVKNATMLEQRRMNICGTQPAVYMKMRGVSTTSGTQKTEEMISAVISKVSDGTFMAMHMYPVGSQPDPQAEAAIYELCPKK